MSVEQSNTLWINLIVRTRPSHQTRQGKPTEKIKPLPRDLTPNGGVTDVGMAILSGHLP